MLLTQEEARKWAEILKGFSEGKSYQIPFCFDKQGNVVEYKSITDFEVNPKISLSARELAREIMKSNGFKIVF